MARRPFDPAEHGWQRTEYRRGDILDRDSVAALVAEADVVVHLAFIIFGDHDEAHRVNLEGSRNVFEATADSAASRLVYTSSVAAYGFDERDRGWLTEEMPAAGTKGFYYSAHKAELELLLRDSLSGSGTDAYVFRPSIVAGADAPTLVGMLTTGNRLTAGAVRRRPGATPCRARGAGSSPRRTTMMTAGERRGYAISPHAGHAIARSPDTGVVAVPHAPQNRCARAHSTTCTARAPSIQPCSPTPRRDGPQVRELVTARRAAPASTLPPKWERRRIRRGSGPLR